MKTNKTKKNNNAGEAERCFAARRPYCPVIAFRAIISMGGTPDLSQYKEYAASVTSAERNID